MASPHEFPAGVIVFERGWLSSNNILLSGTRGTALVDTGYSTHAGQTVALAARALGARPLDAILNTHLHSDHCGGNAALKRAYPGARTLIPPGLANAVRQWDPVALTYEPTGQSCERFAFDGLIEPGTWLALGDLRWEVHAAPGHDPHSVILFEPASRTLISADALWENGFGVVFPELEGESAFGAVGQTLDLIESLAPRWIIPGHGPVFDAGRLPESLAQARSRLESFVRDPVRHARHAAKVLLKFKLLELQAVNLDALLDWASRTGYFSLVIGRYFGDQEAPAWIRALTEDLVRSGVARMEGAVIVNV
ncbi:MBL fold metallo-hydrolase [Caenimonas aquaedulcis]|uniref:MBL fold metallo-hydrolase n=1 Tax=Caenimonas aquaedulcis TaxID=2793270 RepID=A0A931MH94_9BURK|nr:MBL fold metallo-hydrolase [Caenimonas aquaedulcis]MBG9388519.1 MBL fold metallo-hydrolase [Caenimonas aquaedulcis]